ncbi:hypothetical protein E5163_04875 [Marinicauda algicola]|uniref:Uncharacterized protein n=1 Tax=Marinicauda algicola TaxID=2029849 RepID=A0A4S2H481_9PROT|nr:hypothetical protein [Marinicauda algicola]TGY90455.1 hypothetical protein E5163_04875 [Marinicauda algicola]
MDWNSVIWAAAWGAAGGLAGGLVSMLFPARARALIIVVAAVAAGAFGREIEPEVLSEWTGQSWIEERMNAQAYAEFDQALAERFPRMVGAWEVLREHRPDVYNELRRDAIRAARAGSSEEEISDLAQGRIDSLLMELSPQLSDEETARMIDLIRLQLSVLSAEHALACARIMYGQNMSEADIDTLPDAYFPVIVDQFRLIFESSLPGGPKSEGARVQTLINELVSEIFATHPEAGPATFAVYNDPALEIPQEACTVFISYLDEIAELEMPERAHFWRALTAIEG